jgi:hypothetical protein
LLSDERRELDELRADVDLDVEPIEGPHPDDPDHLAWMNDVMRQKEIEWIDQTIPALGGRTPRDAVTDPVGREEVRRILATIQETLPGGYAGFNAARLAALLGLD